MYQWIRFHSSNFAQQCLGNSSLVLAQLVLFWYSCVFSYGKKVPRIGDVLETILCDSVAVPSTFGNDKHAIQSVILLRFKIVIPKQKYQRNMWFQGIKTFWLIVQAVILSLVRHVWYQNSNKNSCASVFNLAFKSWSKSSLSKSKYKNRSLSM